MRRTIFQTSLVGLSVTSKFLLLSYSYFAVYGLGLPLPELTAEKFYIIRITFYLIFGNRAFSMDSHDGAAMGRIALPAIQRVTGYLSAVGGL